MKLLAKFFTHFVILLSLIPPATASRSFEAQRWDTASGAKVVFYPVMELPMLDISVAFHAGSAYDGPSYGLSTLTAKLLNAGNGGLDATAIAEKLADSGAQYEAKNNRDMVSLNLKTLTNPEALQSALQTFSLIINHPDFPESAFKREKNQQLISITQDEESPEEIANAIYYKTLYKDHPYAHSIKGDKDTVSALTLDQVQNFYHQFFVGQNAIIILVGAIDTDTAHQIAEQLSHDLSAGQKPKPIPQAHSLTAPITLKIPYPSSQTVLRLGQLGIDHHDPYYFPLLVGNYTLGGGTLVSRLAFEVREKRGLSYGVSSAFLPMPGLGPFVISLSTQTSQAPIAMEVVESTLLSFLQSGPSAEELVAAKQFLTGSFPQALAGNRNIADMLLKIAFYNLPEKYLDEYVDHINAVSTEQIKQAFTQYLHPDKLLQVSVGKAA